MGDRIDDAQRTTRSVWALARPLPNPASHQYSSSLAFHPSWALLISDFGAGNFRDVLGRPGAVDAILGSLWDVDIQHDMIEVVMKPLFSLRQYSDDPLSMEYCGGTQLSDDRIMQEGKVF